MTWSNRLRKFHRVMAVTFTVTVIITSVALGLGAAQDSWLVYLPLFPLTFLFFTGMYMFVRPYLTKRRGRQPAAA